MKISTLIATCFAIGAALFSSVALAQGESAQDYQYCFSCHGSKGQGNVVIQAPAIAGVGEASLREQLTAYRLKRRGSDSDIDPAGAEMAAVARAIADNEIAQIAKFLSAYKEQDALHDAVQGNEQLGQTNYLQRCSSCHGVNAEGNPMLKAPALSHLNDWYIVSSFKKYLDDSRGTSAQDISAQQMKVMAQTMPADVSIEDIAVYIRYLSTRNSN